MTSSLRELLALFAWSLGLGLMLIGSIRPSSTLAQDTTVTVWSPAEITLRSDSAYRTPQREVEVRARFTGPTGRTVTTSAFWDGGRRFRVRFAPRAPGQWIYRTTASDTTNEGLHGRTGTIEAVPTTSDDPFRRHGWLRVAEDGRRLVHEDGTPFFYLGDTAWEITWKSRLERALRYLDDRAEKGFSAIQIVVMSHQFLNDWGVRNRRGEPFFLDEDFGRLNPRYFDYLDRLVQEVNDRDMVAVLVPLWAYMTELYPDSGPQREKLSEEEALHLAEYVGARYGGHNVLWFVGGDNKYDTPERRAFWGEFARALERGSGGGHLTTIHPTGFDASYDFFDNETEWLDFHSYQSSHIANHDYPWRAAREGWRLRPKKPVLNAEPAYEGIFSRFWAPGDTSEAHTFRIQPVHVRRAIYESVLSGSFVGTAYGANGVWQWNTEELGGSHEPRYTVERAWEMPGAAHAGLLRGLLEKVEWYRHEPAPQLVQPSGTNYAPSIRTDTTAVGYMPSQGGTLDLAEGRIGPDVEIMWIDPVSGDTVSGYRPLYSGGLDAVSPPDTTDWVFALRWGSLADRRARVEETSALSVGGPYPNPSHGWAELDVWLAEEGMVEVRVWNALGQLVRARTRRMSAGWSLVPIQLETPGVYVYAVRLRGGTARTEGPVRRTGRLTVGGL